MNTRGVRLSLAVAVLLSILVGCSEIGLPVATPTPPSGIKGKVVLGPTCPGGQDPGANDPVACLTPYVAMLVVVDSEGAPVARITSGNDGQFSIDLPPGEYVVTPENSQSYPTAQPVPATVAAGTYTEIQVNYDTGIR